ncbi:unnamed protein product [Mytilus coruscus]|uniref:SRCR domain-containing protein n=1 Tax=Mytilus coruscus TaxID=42192 RepID=A0A6J8CXT3_MYTCO|nr:unnamed protein product [Mytilus coruscus]
MIRFARLTTETEHWVICSSASNSYQESLWDDVGASAVCRMLNKRKKILDVSESNAFWVICAFAWNSYQEPLWDDVGATAVCRMLNKSFSYATATHIPYDYPGFPATANNIQHLYCPRGASHLGECFYGGYISYSEEKLASAWQPGACREEDLYYQLTRRGGVRCNV